MRSAVLVGLLLLAGCSGSEDRPDAADRPDAGDAGVLPDAAPMPEDAGRPDTGSREDAGETDAGPPVACGATPFAGGTLSLDPGPMSTQIHVNVAYDGEGIWAAYSLPARDGSGNFRTWATRIACNGAYWLEPFMVTTSTAGNDIDPSLAVSNDTVMIVWQRDTGASPYNLETLFRRFKRSGEPLDATERRLELERGGSPFTGNIWMPDVDRLPGGGFAIVGSWAHEDAAGFQVFAVRMTATGTTGGEAFDVHLEPDQTQLAPDVAADRSGDLWVGWENGFAEESRAVFTRVPASSTIAAFAPVTPVNVTSGGAHLGVGEGDDGLIALDVYRGGGVDILLRTSSTATAAELWSGGASSTDHSPGFALSGPRQGALTWYRAIRGFRNDIYVRAFGPDGDGSLAGTPPVKLDLQEPAAPYGPAITHVLDDWFFLAWQEGDNPDFFIKGRFLELPPP